MVDPTLPRNPGSTQQNSPELLNRVPDNELIERVLAGDMSAARQLYDAHVGAVFRLAMRMTSDRQLADDATQEAFVRVFRGLREFRHDASLKTWIYQIALSAILNARRGHRRWEHRTTEIEDADVIGDAGHRNRPMEIEPDLREQLYTAISALPDIYRSVFVLHEIEGHTHVEIGARLGIPSGTCKARLSEARSRLRAALRAFEGEWASA